MPNHRAAPAAATRPGLRPGEGRRPTFYVGRSTRNVGDHAVRPYPAPRAAGPADGDSGVSPPQQRLQRRGFAFPDQNKRCAAPNSQTLPETRPATPWIPDPRPKQALQRRGFALSGVTSVAKAGNTLPGRERTRRRPDSRRPQPRHTRPSSAPSAASARADRRAASRAPCRSPPRSLGKTLAGRGLSAKTRARNVFRCLKNRPSCSCVHSRDPTCNLEATQPGVREPAVGTPQGAWGLSRF
jgi:hypothetical protein